MTQLTTQLSNLLGISVLAQEDDAAAAGVRVLGVIYLLILLLVIVSAWKMYAKAGQPGWACLIPFYNVIVLCLIAGRPGWWFILMMIPVVNIIVGIIVCLDLAKAFGKGPGFGLGLVFLSVIFVPVLGFGSATYQGPQPARMV